MYFSCGLFLVSVIDCGQKNCKICAKPMNANGQRPFVYGCDSSMAEAKSYNLLNPAVPGHVSLLT